MDQWSLRATLAVLFLGIGNFARAEDCYCSPGSQRVSYVVVEMPAKPSEVYASISPLALSLATSSPVSSTISLAPGTTSTRAKAEAKATYTPPARNKPPVEKNVHPENTTHTYTPCSAPKIDRANLKNILPAKNITLSYSSDEENQTGAIDINLAFNNPAVVLEHVEAVSGVACADDALTVTFTKRDAFEMALEDWNTDEPFILITGSAGNCAAEFERGFFIVDNVIPDADELTITVTAHKKDLADIAGELEMTFSSLPAATLTRRLTLNPKYAITFSEGLPDRTTIFSDGRYIDITAEEAWFSSTLTFSGKLKYNFWGFKLQELYFDIDAEFDSSAAISAEIRAAFNEAIRYQPDDLAYSLVDIPGIISLGPGIAFGLALDVAATAAVGIYTGVDISLPAGNVHVDFLDGSKTGTSGWEPQYNSYANLTQAADVRLDVGADVTVMLKFKLLGGLVDLSSGITASPGFANTFKLRGQQDAKVNGTTKGIEAGIEVPTDALQCADTNGIEFISDFFFSVTAFATKWFNKELYSVRVPLVDYCLSF